MRRLVVTERKPVTTAKLVTANQAVTPSQPRHTSDSWMPAPILLHAYATPDQAKWRGAFHRLRMMRISITFKHAPDVPRCATYLDV